MNFHYDDYRERKVEKAFLSASPIYERFEFSEWNNVMGANYALYVYDRKTERIVEEVSISRLEILTFQGSIESALSRHVYGLRSNLDHYLLCEELMLSKRPSIVWC